VTVRLLRTDTGDLLWSDRFDYPSVADWAAQQNILARVANLLDLKVQQSVLERAVLSPPSSTAVDHWMRGTYLMTTLETREQLALARGHFEAALAAQPDSVPALAGLGFYACPRGAQALEQGSDALSRDGQGVGAARARLEPGRSDVAEDARRLPRISPARWTKP
jgi:hypothetical protein